MKKVAIKETIHLVLYLIPLLLKNFFRNQYTLNEIGVFVRTIKPIYKGEYVIFTKPVEGLEEIITMGFAYRVYRSEFGKATLYLDNEYTHLIPYDYLQQCPPQEKRWRTKRESFEMKKRVA